MRSPVTCRKCHARRANKPFLHRSDAFVFLRTSKNVTQSWTQTSVIFASWHSWSRLCIGELSPTLHGLCLVPSLLSHPSSRWHISCGSSTGNASTVMHTSSHITQGCRHDRRSQTKGPTAINCHIDSLPEQTATLLTMPLNIYIPHMCVRDISRDPTARNGERTYVSTAAVHQHLKHCEDHQSNG